MPGLFGTGEHTEDELFGGREHVYSKSHLILIDLEANPPDHGRGDPEQEVHDGNQHPAGVCGRKILRKDEIEANEAT